MPPDSSAPQPHSAWRWVPSLYFSQGLPNVVMTSVAVVMFKNLGVSNTDIALYTSAAYLPWVLKPLWSPLVELTGSPRRWIVGMQLLLGLVFVLIALALPGTDFVRYTVALLWIMAFTSATHDIAADGFYLAVLPAHEQAAFVGVRSTFFRLSWIAGKGGLVWLAGWLLVRTGGAAQAWAWVFALLAGWFFLSAAVHGQSLPVVAELPRPRGGGWAEAVEVFASFAAKPGIGLAILFMLTYRLAEALALKLVEPFLLDPVPQGGLGLTVQQVGVAYGGVGTGALLAGGLLGGWLISCHGLKRMLWPMLGVMHVPIVVFWLLARAQPDSLAVITAALAVEQFGYGFGFTAYMVYLMMFAAGAHKTAHYAICTGFMAAGIMLPGMAAGWIEEQLGYEHFFLLVCAATLPSFLAAALIKIDPAFGQKG